MELPTARERERCLYVEIKRTTNRQQRIRNCLKVSKINNVLDEEMFGLKVNIGGARSDREPQGHHRGTSGFFDSEHFPHLEKRCPFLPASID